jgi:hypothetical protein
MRLRIAIAALAITVSAVTVVISAIITHQMSATDGATPPPRTTVTLSRDNATAAAALGAVDTLNVGIPASLAGYSRDRFGPPWADTDGNGCDQRYDVLVRDATATGAVSTQAIQGRCKVTQIRLVDPYTGRTLTSTAAIQIDHVVPLADAWRGGAGRWTDAQRQTFANDTANLLAVDGPTNEAKGDKPPDRWLPPQHDTWCRYAAVYAAISARYQLTVSVATRDTLREILVQCA